MSSLAIVCGLGATAFIFAYYAFQFRESQLENNQRIAVFFLFVSLAFLNLLFYATYIIAQNEVSYLTGGFLESGLMVMIWTNAALMLYLFISSIVSAIMWLKDAIPDWIKGSERLK